MTVYAQVTARVWSNACARGALLATGGALVMAALAQIRIDLFMVPITLQTLGVLALAAFLGPRIAAAALAEYLLLGLAGVPWFAGGKGGLLALAGPTGGYMLAFPVAAFVSGWLYVRLRHGAYVRQFAGTLLAGLAGAVVIQLGGTAWLSVLFFRGDLPAAALVGCAPFLLVDALKALVVASAVAGRK